MAYDFIGKIKEARNERNLDLDVLRERVDDIGKNYHKPLQVKIVFSEKSPRDLLVKASISVSSFPSAHIDDLNSAVAAFKHYLEEISLIVNGMVSRTEGFYNNDKNFYPLY